MITLKRERNMLWVTLPDGCGSDLVRKTEELMTMKKLEHLRGMEAKVRGKKCVIEYEPLFNRVGPGKYITFAGFEDRLYKGLAPYGQVSYVGDGTLSMHQPDMEYLKTVEFRDAQVDLLAPIISLRQAQLDACTGAGKTFLVGVICRMFSQKNCRIVICTQLTNVFNGLYRRICQTCPTETIGRVGNGYNDNCRITVSTMKSLHKISDPTKIDIVLCDEVHSAGARDAFSSLKEFINARMYGLSATTNSREDGTDMLVEALFGEVKCSVSFTRGQQEGFIPPVKAFFYRLYCQDVTAQYSDPSFKQRKGVWENPTWNEAVIRIAKHWESKLKTPEYDPQLLVMSNSVEHIYRLCGVGLPDYTMIYRQGPTAEAVNRLTMRNQYPTGHGTKLSDQEREYRVRCFEQGVARRVLSTTCLGTGVDAPGLDVIIRADGGSSEISNVQFRGRVTRGDSGVYCDLLIEGDKYMEAKSQKRLRSCKKAGWEVHVVDLP